MAMIKTWLTRFVILLLFCINVVYLQAQNLEGIGKQKPFAFHGDIANNLIMYHVSGIPARNKALTYVMSGNFIASFYGISLPFSFTLSNQQSNYSQPFNQFGLSPSYKWITVHAGYRSVRFSDFTLSGHTFAGAGIELTPGKFRFSLIGGRFNQSTVSNTYARVDSLPSFKRNGVAMKIGVGGRKTFVDLIMLRIKDDNNSLPKDSVYPYRTPEENLVTGLNSRITFSKNLVFEGEGAVSVYTGNQQAPGLSGSDGDKLKKVQNIILVNQSSTLTTAAKVSLVYRIKDFSIRTEYRRIDPDFTSMGSYFFNNDLASITIGPSFSLLKKKLFFRGNIGFQHDNLKGTKKTTSKRTVGSANISLNPVKWFGMDASYSNFSIIQHAGNIPLVDTLKIYQSTQNISVTPRLIFINTDYSHMVMLVYNRSNLIDKNPSTQQITDNTATILNLNYMLGLLQKKITLTSGLNYMVLHNHYADNKATGVSLGVAGLTAKDKLSLSWNNTLLRSEYLQNKGWIYSTNFTASYKHSKHHQFRVGIYFTGNHYQKSSTAPSFNETKGDMSYVYSF